MTEFNLSDKEGIGEYLPNWNVYKSDDVKEFIRLLIEELENNDLKEFIPFVDKIAGAKLNGV